MSIVIAAAILASVGHQVDCPYCKLPVVQNTKEQDNEVVLKLGNKRIEYRSLFCVMKDQGRYKADLIVYAPSEVIGEPVILRRTEGAWSAPEASSFLNAFKKHADCAALSRAFTSRTALEAYVVKNDISEAKPLTLAEFLDQVSKAKEPPPQ